MLFAFFFLFFSQKRHPQLPASHRTQRHGFCGHDDSRARQGAAHPNPQPAPGFEGYAAGRTARASRGEPVTDRGSLDAGGFGDLARTDAAGADDHAARLSVYRRADRLQVRKAPGLRQVVSMADVVTSLRLLAAYLTFSGHGITPSCADRNKKIYYQEMLFQARGN